LDENDLNNMASFLHLPVDEVKEKYLRVSNSVVQMKIVDGHCIFFNGGCTIHTGKPWRCTQWPLHPSILHDKNNFETIKSSCPGIAKNMGYEEFCDKLKTLLHSDE
jgi:hypothetical protein